MAVLPFLGIIEEVKRKNGTLLFVVAWSVECQLFFLSLALLKTWALFSHFRITRHVDWINGLMKNSSNSSNKSDSALNADVSNVNNVDEANNVANVDNARPGGYREGRRLRGEEQQG